LARIEVFPGKKTELAGNIRQNIDGREDN